VDIAAADERKLIDMTLLPAMMIKNAQYNRVYALNPFSSTEQSATGYMVTEIDQTFLKFDDEMFERINN
jgi:cytolysin (calcineurin-like family phosphatase)